MILHRAYRHTVIEPDKNEILYSQLEDLMDIAIFECEKYYPAFQLVLFEDYNPREALEICTMDVVGKA